MPNKFVRVTIDIELENDVQELVSKIASRAHTIQGVANAYDVGMEPISRAYETIERVAVRQLTWWESVKSWFGK